MFEQYIVLLRGIMSITSIKVTQLCFLFQCLWKVYTHRVLTAFLFNFIIAMGHTCENSESLRFIMELHIYSKHILFKYPYPNCMRF